MKHCDSVNQSKQQRYHQGLKTLESTVEKMALLDAKMNEAEAKNLEGRKISTRL